MDQRSNLSISYGDSSIRVGNRARPGYPKITIRHKRHALKGDSQAVVLLVLCSRRNPRINCGVWPWRERPVQRPAATTGSETNRYNTPILGFLGQWMVTP